MFSVAVFRAASLSNRILNTLDRLSLFNFHSISFTTQRCKIRAWSTKCWRDGYITIGAFHAHSNLVIYLKVFNICPCIVKSPSNGFTNKVLKGSAFSLQLSGIEWATGVMYGRLANAPKDDRNNLMRQTGYPSKRFDWFAGSCQTSPREIVRPIRLFDLRKSFLSVSVIGLYLIFPP